MERCFTEQEIRNWRPAWREMSDRDWRYIRNDIIPTFLDENGDGTFSGDGQDVQDLKQKIGRFEWYLTSPAAAEREPRQQTKPPAPRTRKQRREPIPVSLAILSPEEQDRALRWHAFFVWRARHRDDVRRERQELLGDRFLSPEEALAFPETPFLEWFLGILGFDYPWSKGQAKLFLLCDAEPTVPVASWDIEHAGLHDHERGWLTYRVQPWVSPKTLARVHREARSKFMRSPDIRPMKPRSLAVFDFVTGNWPADSQWEGGPRMPGQPEPDRQLRLTAEQKRELWEAWKVGRPEPDWYKSPKEFFQAFNRVVSTLTHPHYRAAEVMIEQGVLRRATKQEREALVERGLLRRETKNAGDDA